MFLCGLPPVPGCQEHLVGTEKAAEPVVIQLGWGARGGCRLPREDVDATSLQVLMDGLDVALRKLV